MRYQGSNMQGECPAHCTLSTTPIRFPLMPLGHAMLYKLCPLAHDYLPDLSTFQVTAWSTVLPTKIE